MTKTPAQKSDVNVTPYIDILLVLLIIFMVVQPTTQYDLRARVPERPSQTTPLPQSAPIVVSIDSEGSIQLNHESVPYPQLGSRLFEVLSRRADKRLFVKAEADLPFGDVVGVIDVAKGAGAGDIGLM